jgi:hypothetical protein
MKTMLLTMLLAVGLAPMMPAQEAANKVIPAGSKVFIAPMEDNFQDYLKAALQAKKVPVVVVDDKASADFEITGHSETEKASTAKKVIMWNWHSNEQASIQVTNLKTSEVAFAYSANKQSSAHGKKSTAEACAKHLKEKIESKK